MRNVPRRVSALPRRWEESTRYGSDCGGTGRRCRSRPGAAADGTRAAVKESPRAVLGGGVERRTEPIVGIVSMLVDRDEVSHEVDFYDARREEAP